MRQRRVLEMSRDELRAVTAIVMPGRKGDELAGGEMQEMCIKWLFANGLSINHVFEIHEETTDGPLFCVMRNDEACWCCPKASETGTLTEFDRGPIGDNYKRAPSPKPKVTQKVTPITVQPTIVTLPDTPTAAELQKRKEADAERDISACAYCKRECGLCIVALCSQF